MAPRFKKHQKSRASVFQSCVTQIDLLAESSRSGWHSREGNFMSQCVGFDSSGLHVLVQHNSLLTGRICLFVSLFSFSYASFDTIKLR